MYFFTLPTSRMRVRIFCSATASPPMAILESNNLNARHDFKLCMCFIHTQPTHYITYLHFRSVSLKFPLYNHGSFCWGRSMYRTGGCDNEIFVFGYRWSFIVTLIRVCSDSFSAYMNISVLSLPIRNFVLDSIVKRFDLDV